MSIAGKLVFRIGARLEDIDREIVRCVTPNRIAILEHVAAHDRIASTRALSVALGRDYSGVHADVAELVKLGLLERDGIALRCEIDLDIAELAVA